MAGGYGYNDEYPTAKEIRVDWQTDTTDVNAQRGDLASKLVLAVVLLIAFGIFGASWLARRPAPQNTPATASHLAWIQYPQVALVQGQKKARPLLVRFVAPWCGVCTRMEREIFSRPDVIAAIDQSFVPLSVDVTRSSNGPFANRYEIQYLPTLLVLTPDGREIARSSGMMTGPELLQWLSDSQTRLKSVASTVGAAG